MNARAVAARVLVRVIGDGQSLRTALPTELDRLRTDADRPFAQSLVYATLRWWLPLRQITGQRLKKPMRAKDLDVEALLCLGAYQLLSGETEPHAAVNETVTAARMLGKPWAAGMINAILRALQREHNEEWPPAPETAHPGWLRRRLVADWGDESPGLLAANQSAPPMWLRVNTRMVAPADYCQLLEQADIPVAWHADSSILLASPVPVVRLPGFSTGQVSVQDRAAQQAAMLVDPQNGERVLDACAAPGGKTAHLLEAGAEELVALDIDEDRMSLVRETLDRLQLDATLVAADALDVDTWWDGKCFDKILLDAPCSATGVIRRHPDIKFLRRASDITTFAEIQVRLIQALWPTLKPWGRLVYATCSVLTAENDDVVGAVVAKADDMSVQPCDVDWGAATSFGRRVATGSRGMDGFYYACLEKTPTR